MWGCMPVIPAFGKMRQKDHKFKVSLGYIVGSRLKKQTNKRQKT
jgi:hypothetical protein